MVGIGDHVDRWVVEEEIGRGGMATVFRVRHRALGGEYALKVLHIFNAGMAARLLQEGQVQARLRHPNIVTVHDVLEVSGQPALLMEFVRGPSLHDLLQDRGVPLEELLRLFSGVLQGVRAAHASGVVHRDLKPANVLVDTSVFPSCPKVTDFGLARAAEDGDPNRTRSGVTMGTVAYMPPEQLRDAKRADHRADVYALSCMLYEMVCGRRPFEDPDLWTTMTAKLNGDYPPPESVVPDIPAPVAAAIRHGLAADRAARLPDCDSLGEVLSGQISGVAIDDRIQAAAREPERRNEAPPGQPPASPTMATLAPALGSNVGVERTSRAATPTPFTWAAPEHSVPEAPVDARRPEPSVASLSPTPIVSVNPSESSQGGAAPPHRRWIAIGIAAVTLVTVGGIVGRFVGGPDGEVESATIGAPAASEDPDPVQTEPTSTAPPPSEPAAASPAVPTVTTAAGTATPSPTERPTSEAPKPGTQSEPPKATKADPPAAVLAPPKPVPAEPATAVVAPSLPASGRVTLSGEYQAAWLEDAAGGRHPPGELSSGRYRLLVRFSADGEILPSGTVSVSAGENVRLHCDSAFRLCRRQ